MNDNCRLATEIRTIYLVALSRNRSTSLLPIHHHLSTASYTHVHAQEEMNVKHPTKHWDIIFHNTLFSTLIRNIDEPIFHWLCVHFIEMKMVWTTFLEYIDSVKFERHCSKFRAFQLHLISRSHTDRSYFIQIQVCVSDDIPISATETNISHIYHELILCNISQNDTTPG